MRVSVKKWKELDKDLKNKSKHLFKSFDYGLKLVGILKKIGALRMYHKAPILLLFNYLS